jgi:hypothetical protein
VLPPHTAGGKGAALALAAGRGNAGGGGERDGGAHPHADMASPSETAGNRDTSPYLVRMQVEALSGIVSALTVAPAVSIVDKAIVSNASGRQALVPSLLDGVKTLFSRPVFFFRQPSFLLIWGVYSGTYIAANTIDATCERAEQSAVVPKFIGSSATNVTLSMAKDVAFVRLFGQGVPRPVPALSYGLFATRDTGTVLASFTLPDTVSNGMQESMGASKAFSDTSAQLFTPCAMQMISSPLHLLGLDLYNRPEASSAKRVSFIKQEYLKTSLARIARIFPAFGVGGVVNKSIRHEAKMRFCVDISPSRHPSGQALEG